MVKLDELDESPRFELDSTTASQKHWKYSSVKIRVADN